MQLNRIARVFEGHEIVFATVNKAYRTDVPDHHLYVVRDATRWNRFGLVWLALQSLWILLRERPDIVLSTGAAPGFFAIVLGRILGAKTIWVDSIANIERLSRSGLLVRKWAGLWLTQWPHLATDEGPEYAGKVF